jgi:hypothetical protein
MTHYRLPRILNPSTQPSPSILSSCPTARPPKQNTSIPLSNLTRKVLDSTYFQHLPLIIYSHLSSIQVLPNHFKQVSVSIQGTVFPTSLLAKDATISRPSPSDPTCIPKNVSPNIIETLKHQELFIQIYTAHSNTPTSPHYSRFLCPSALSTVFYKPYTRRSSVLSYCFNILSSIVQGHL